MEKQVIKRKGISPQEVNGSFPESGSHLQQTKQGMHQKDTNQYGSIFWLSVAASQAVGLACIVLVVFWGKKYGGFDMSDAELMFNYHPLFMVLGLIFFYGDAIIIYRVLSFLPKKVLKLVHGGLQVSAIIFSSVALVAVFENHRKTNRADLYSLHSWMGILTFGSFCLMYVGSFVTFLYPGLPGKVRGMVMPFHTFLGMGLFVMAAATSCTGITEKLLWTDGYTDGEMNVTHTVGNVLGLLILVFVILIIYIVTHSKYKRVPRPSDVEPQR